MSEYSEVNSVLSVSLITDALGDFLAVEELKDCRRVSKDWYNWFGPILRKKSKLVVNNLSDFQKLFQHPDDNYWCSPHKQVVLKIKHLEGPMLHGNMNSFWSTHGNNLTYLKLENVEGCEDNILYDILYRQAPNMKTLVLTNCFRELGSGRMFFDQLIDIPEDVKQKKLKHLEIDQSATFLRREEHVELLKILFETYPNISSLRLNRYLDGPISGQKSLGEVFTHLGEIQKISPDNYQLKELDILLAYKSEDSIQLPFLNTLERVHFPLKRLSIDLGGETGVKVAAGILHLYRETLERVDIYRIGSAVPYADFPFGIEFPSLKVLDMSDCVAENLRFLKMMPKLERLILCGWMYKNEFMRAAASDFGFGENCGEKSVSIIDRTTDEEMKDVEAKCLREITYAHILCSKQMKNKISKWMPKVTMKPYVSKKGKK